MRTLLRGVLSARGAGGRGSLALERKKGRVLGVWGGGGPNFFGTLWFCGFLAFALMTTEVLDSPALNVYGTGTSRGGLGPRLRLGLGLARPGSEGRQRAERESTMVPVKVGEVSQARYEYEGWSVVLRSFVAFIGADGAAKPAICAWI